MCDNCPSKITEHGPEWTRETSKPTGERPLPAPGGRKTTTNGSIRNVVEDSIRHARMNVGFTINSHEAAEQNVSMNVETIMAAHQAAIDAAVKEAQIGELKELNLFTDKLGEDYGEFECLDDIEKHVRLRLTELNQPQEKK